MKQRKQLDTLRNHEAGHEPGYFLLRRLPERYVRNEFDVLAYNIKRVYVLGVPTMIAAVLAGGVPVSAISKGMSLLVNMGAITWW